MLEDLNITKTTGNELTLGFDTPLSQKKAANHNQGITVTERQFFGLRKEDINKIKKEFKDDIRELKRDQRQRRSADEEEGLTLAQFLTQQPSSLDNLLARLFDNGDES